MNLLGLPSELLWKIVGFLEYESEISALDRTHGILYDVVNPMLYRHNVRFGHSSALDWAIINHSIPTVRLSLEAGASPHERGPNAEYSPTALAAIHGDVAILQLLWEQEVNYRGDKECLKPSSENRKRFAGILMLLAAERGRENMVRFLMDHLPRNGDVDYPTFLCGCTALLHAAQEGHLPVVRLLVDAGANLEAKDEEGWTALKLAAKDGYHDVVKLLISRGADPIAGFEDSQTTPIFEAAKHGHFETVRCLLDAGVMDMMPPSRLQNYPIEASAVHQHWDVVKLLLEEGGGYKQLGTKQGSILTMAASLGDIALLREQLKGFANETEAKVDNFDLENLVTWIINAGAEYGHKEVIQLMLDRGPQLLSKSMHEVLALARRRNIPLARAAAKGFEPIVELLLEAGANPDQRDITTTSEKPALKLAIPFEGTFRRLLEAGADPKELWWQGDEEPVSVASTVVASGLTAQVQALLDCDIDLVQCVSDPGLLLLAIEGGKVMIEFLYQKRQWDHLLIAKNLTPDECQIALGLAAHMGEVDLVQFLIDYGFLARIPGKPKVDLLARAAASAGKNADPRATLDLLLKSGLNIDNELGGSTALGRIALLGDATATRLLLERGANPLPQCQPFDSPLYKAVFCESHDVVELLLHEIDARREPWAVVAPYLQAAVELTETAEANEVHAKKKLRKVRRALRQWSWRKQYPVDP